VFGADGTRLFDLTLTSMKESLSTAIGEMFLVAVAIMAVACVISVFLQEIPLRRTFEVPEAEGETPAAPSEAPAVAPTLPVLRPAPGRSVAQLTADDHP
jgi:hypothetical protein